MTTRRIFTVVAALSLAVLFVPDQFTAAKSQSQSQPLKDDDDDDVQDHVKAFEALKSGKIVPISTIIDWMEKNFRGSIVEIELEFVGDYPPMYEVEYVTDEGNFLEFDFDAATGALIRVQGAGVESARKKP